MDNTVLKNGCETFTFDTFIKVKHEGKIKTIQSGQNRPNTPNTPHVQPRWVLTGCFFLFIVLNFCSNSCIACL